MLTKIIYNFVADRIGPDLPFSHSLLYFKWSMRMFCKKKFKSFGEGSEIRPHAFISGCRNISVGDRTVIRPLCFVYASNLKSDYEGGIVIEKDVLIGNGCHIYASNHIFTDTRIPIAKQGHKRYPNILISEGAWIGSNSVILPGVTIGRNSVIGAGSVVTKSIPPFTLYAGNPAKFIRKIGS
jgi:acetyltransferase-like isoleucine patch superfamily enzyme